MDDGAGCGRAGEIEDACALIENDDASTPQVRTNDNLLNIERTSLFAAFLGTSRGSLEMEPHADDFCQRARPSCLGFLCGWLIAG
jgi:hypothetical protein